MLDAAYAAIADGVAGGGLPSGVLAVANADELQRLEAFGPVAADSIFLLASITKPIFATSVMRLVERGRVLLDEPIAGMIPEFAANGKGDVRLWHLLTHTSGLDEGWIDRRRTAPSAATGSTSSNARARRRCRFRQGRDTRTATRASSSWRSWCGG